MSIKGFKEALEKRKLINSEYQWNEADDIWKLEAKELAENLEETINFLENQCTAEEMSWISETYEDLFEYTNYNLKLRDSLYKLCKKYPNEAKKYYIEENLDGFDFSNSKK